MTTLDEKFLNFKNNNNLSDDAMKELLTIFNESFIDVAHKLLRDVEPVQKSKKEKYVKKDQTKKWATKIAQEYAEDNNLTLDDFETESKITKKHIDDLLKNKTKNIKTVVVTESKDVATTKCCGITVNGCPCNKPGTKKPDGSNKVYCTKHYSEWKNFEVSSDSDSELDFED